MNGEHSTVSDPLLDSDPSAINNEPEVSATRRDFIKNLMAGVVASFVPRNIGRHRSHATEPLPQPNTEVNKSNELIHDNFILLLDDRGVPIGYRFKGQETEEPIMFDENRVYTYSVYRKEAIELGVPIMASEVFKDLLHVRSVLDTIPADVKGEYEAGVVSPDVLTEQELASHGVRVLNPDESNPQVLIRKGAFSPDGLLYPISLLHRINGDRQPALNMIISSSTILDMNALTEEQKNVIDVFKQANPQSFFEMSFFSMERSILEFYEFLRKKIVIPSRRELAKRLFGKKEVSSNLEELVLAELSGDELINHYAQETKEFRLGVVRGISVRGKESSSQFLVAALGLPPPGHDWYSFSFGADGNIIFHKMQTKHNLEDTRMEQLVRNRNASPPSPELRPWVDGYADLDDSVYSYVVGLEDMGYILRHEVTHVLNNTISILIEKGELIRTGDGTVAPAPSSQLEQMISEDRPEEKPLFMNVKFPIDSERKTDEATKFSMDEAFKEWLEHNDDSGFPFVIKLPPHGKDPARYKITNVPAQQV